MTPLGIVAADRPRRLAAGLLGSIRTDLLRGTTDAPARFTGSGAAARSISANLFSRAGIVAGGAAVVGAERSAGPIAVAIGRSSWAETGPALADLASRTEVTLVHRPVEVVIAVVAHFGGRTAALDAGPRPVIAGNPTPTTVVGIAEGIDAGDSAACLPARTGRRRHSLLRVGAVVLLGSLDALLLPIVVLDLLTPEQRVMRRKLRGIAQAEETQHRATQEPKSPATRLALRKKTKDVVEVSAVHVRLR